MNKFNKPGDIHWRNAKKQLCTKKDKTFSDEVIVQLMSTIERQEKQIDDLARELSKVKREVMESGILEKNAVEDIHEVECRNCEEWYKPPYSHNCCVCHNYDHFASMKKKEVV